MRIRPATAADSPVLQDIETAAGELFRSTGMDAIADDEPFPADVLARYAHDGRSWVAVDDDRPVGYLLVDLVDGNWHIEQVSVHPDHAGHGIGRALIDHVADEARRAGSPALTLTTFTEVPWNAPYYARCGFRALPDDEVTPGLRAVRATEAEHGLDRWPRVCMRREL
ncbi:GNAT family N-acetyltransferase [Yinghuangia seranimata]|uniref:GNAT family N-acetyltransferase n=1 Tax=Yinghuangia seranimata TaxID=408067 RepID=UPI00248D074D|nr:GNAT family N-acetyltransferase [Yinghuangia seranimata]MDI2129634.1 GNAT family N-acetyltransferase [Yinghuangia seranimata]